MPGSAAPRRARLTPMSPHRLSCRVSGFESLRDLPDIEKLEDAGLLGRTGEGALGGDALAAELKGVLGLAADDVDEGSAEDDAA